MSKISYTKGKNKLYEYRVDYYKNELFHTWPNSHYCSNFGYAKNFANRKRTAGFIVEVYKFPATLNPFKIFIYGTKVNV